MRKVIDIQNILNLNILIINPTWSVVTLFKDLLS